MVWAVALSTMDLFTHSVSPNLVTTVFGVYLGLVSQSRPPSRNSALPPS